MVPELGTPSGSRSAPLMLSASCGTTRPPKTPVRSFPTSRFSMIVWTPPKSPLLGLPVPPFQSPPPSFWRVWAACCLPGGGADRKFPGCSFPAKRRAGDVVQFRLSAYKERLWSPRPPSLQVETPPWALRLRLQPAHHHIEKTLLRKPVAAPFRMHPIRPLGSLRTAPNLLHFMMQNFFDFCVRGAGT